MSDPSDGSSSAVRLSVRMSARQAGTRLDRALAESLPELSRSRIKVLIEAGQVSIGARPVRAADHPVQDGDSVAITLPPPGPAEPAAQPIPLVVVYEDADLIVVDKPAGLVVHPAAGNPDGTLVNALLSHCGASLAGIGGQARPGIVHRIDKETSGLLVAAKTERALASLGRQFAAHTIERVYTCVVWGAPRAAEGTVEGNIGRSPHDRKKMAVLRTGGKPARTHFRVVARYGPPAAPWASRLECRLETGRTHQIRVHMAHLGHPLVGDRTYGRPRPAGPKASEALARLAAFPRQALHAGVLGFQHPRTHRTLRFESPLPGDMVMLVTALERGVTPS